MYPQDRVWSDSYVFQIKSILTSLMPHLANISVASTKKDNSYATDYEVKLQGGDIACRLRRAKYHYRDLTIRALRDTGAKTELAKIKGGYASRYFYGWTDAHRTIAEWILIDLDKVRMTPQLLEKPLIPNYGLDGKPDGTYFIAVPASELDETGCLIANHLRRGVLPDKAKRGNVAHLIRSPQLKVRPATLSLWEDVSV